MSSMSNGDFSPYGGYMATSHGKVYRLSYDPRFVIGGCSTLGTTSSASGTFSSRKSLRDSESVAHVLQDSQKSSWSGFVPDLQPLELPKKTFPVLWTNPRCLRLEDLRVSDDRRQQELNQMDSDAMLRNGHRQPAESPYPGGGTMNKHERGEESLADLAVLPDLFDRKEPTSTRCLNKRMFSADSIYNLKTLPDFEQRSSKQPDVPIATDSGHQKTGRREFNEDSLEDIRQLPSLSSYWKEKEDD